VLISPLREEDEINFPNDAIAYETCAECSQSLACVRTIIIVWKKKKCSLNFLRRSL
jgi:hypothetical protein